MVISPFKRLSTGLSIINQITKAVKAKAGKISEESSVRERMGARMVVVVGVAVMVVVMAVMVPEVAATRWTVGANQGWTTNVNYTIWAKDKHFYNVFVYDRNQMNVLEVNKTDYESCNSDHPLHNWTTGAGRDVVPLNVTRHYYFISGKGFCYGGMKLAVRVENLPPPPSASLIKDKNSAPSSLYGGQLVLPAAFAIGAIWDALVQFW